MEQVQARKKHGEEVVLWLRGNYELSDTARCISKASVYQDYLNMCHAERLVPTTGPAFGKLVRRAFPSVASNRRGPRGHALHMYSGLKKRGGLSMVMADGHSGSSHPTSTLPSPDFITEYSFVDVDFPVRERRPDEVVPPAGGAGLERDGATLGNSPIPSRRGVPPPRQHELMYVMGRGPPNFGAACGQQPSVPLDVDGVSRVKKPSGFVQQGVVPHQPPAASGSATREDKRWLDTTQTRGDQASSSAAPGHYAQLPLVASFSDFSEWTAYRDEVKVDSSDEIAALPENVDKRGMDLVGDQHQDSVGWSMSGHPAAAANPNPPRQWLAMTASASGGLAAFPRVHTRPHSQSDPQEYRHGHPLHYPIQQATAPPGRWEYQPPRQQSLDMNGVLCSPGDFQLQRPVRRSYEDHYGTQFGSEHPPFLQPTTSSSSSPPRMPSHWLHSIPRPHLSRSAEPSPRAPPPVPIQMPPPAGSMGQRGFPLKRSLSTKIFFDPSAVDSKYNAELAAFSSLCRLYYSNLFDCIISCNLDSLRNEVDRFWDLVGKDFGNILHYDSVSQRLLQIENSVFQELSEVLMTQEMGLSLTQLSVYMHNIAVMLPSWLSRARKPMLPHSVFSALHETVSDFALMLFRQSLRLQKLASPMRYQPPL